MRKVQTQDRIYEYDEINSKLGSGAFADVYKGTKLQTNEIVAIKVISKPKMQKYGDDILKAIGSEVNILQQISTMHDKDPCPFICKIYDCFETSNHIYIILEFCNQGNLLDLANKRKKENNKLTYDESIYIIYQVISAVEYLSKNNITHRDIKPENIFISDGVYKLGDFGFASQKQLYQTTLGTYPYMAPEFFTEQSYDKAIDVWALGVMLHELLFDELYFIGKSTIEVSKKIIEKPYVIQKPHLISPEAQDLLKKMIDKNKNTRISASQAVLHPLFYHLKNDTKIISLFKTKSDEILQQIQNIRNGCFFFYELGETLENWKVNDYKFEIFYLYKKGLIKLLELGNNLQTQQIPKLLQQQQNFQKEIQPNWVDFLNSNHYINCLNLLNNDREVLTRKFQSCCNSISAFVQQNFPNNVLTLQQIINDDLLKDIPQNIFDEQLKQTFDGFLALFQAETDKNSQMARFYLRNSFICATLTTIDQTIVNQKLNFEEFQANKNNYTTANILDMIAKQKQ